MKFIMIEGSESECTNMLTKIGFGLVQEGKIIINTKDVEKTEKNPNKRNFAFRNVSKGLRSVGEVVNKVGRKFTTVDVEKTLNICRSTAWTRCMRLVKMKRLEIIEQGTNNNPTVYRVIGN